MNRPADADAATSTDRLSDEAVQAPPHGVLATLRQLGPGLIIAGSIVGSGELIATTKTGAQAGIVLMWLIIIGCLIKVFVQIELGRYSITHGQTTLAALNTLPGRVGRVNWMLWYWLVMMAASIAQLGGIVGGVGQALAISFPITGDYAEATAMPSQSELEQYLDWQSQIDADSGRFAALTPAAQERVLFGQEMISARLARLAERGEAALQTVRSGGTLTDPRTMDDRYWAGAVSLLTMFLLYIGRYNLIQNITTVLVVAFTFITLGNVYALQTTPQWSIPLEEWIRGLTFSLPEGRGIVTALATFGIIGVGATELVAYPYWCIEKGYGRFTGRRTDDPGWAERARGWMHVMHIDAFVSMIIYTVATLASFVTGAAVLYRQGMDPDGMRMVTTLAESYVPVFGEYAKWLFLTGAFAVLFSTFLVALASQARMYTDALKVWGLMGEQDPVQHDRVVAAFGAVLPLVCLALYWGGLDPVGAVLLSGTMQALMLPLLAFSALYFRYKCSDPRLAPSRSWDAFLIISSIGMLIAGGWGAYQQITGKLLPMVTVWLNGAS